MSDIHMQKNKEMQEPVSVAPYEEFIQNRIFINEYYENEQQNVQVDRESIKEALAKNYNFEYKYATGGAVSLKEDDKQLNKKERDQQEKEKAAAIKKSRKQYPAGTEHTLSIVEQNNAYLEKRPEVKPPMYANQRSKGNLERATAYAKLQALYENDSEIMLNLRGSDIPGAIIKKDNFDYATAHKFTPEYISKNYADAKITFDKIMALSKFIRWYDYSSDKIEPLNVTWDFDFLKFADMCKEMMDNALLANGLKLNAETDELIAAEVKECKDAAFKNAEMANELKKLFTFRDAANKLNDDLYRFKTFYKVKEGEMNTRRNAGEDTSDIEHVLFKVLDEIRLMESINRKLYLEPYGLEELTQQENEYAMRNGYMEGETYKEELQAKLKSYSIIMENPETQADRPNTLRTRVLPSIMITETPIPTAKKPR